jgi:hypothetical protein
MKDPSRIQERFLPEPIFAKTGHGHLKSEGTATGRRIKASCLPAISQVNRQFGGLDLPPQPKY